MINFVTTLLPPSAKMNKWYFLLFKNNKSPNYVTNFKTSPTPRHPTPPHLLPCGPHKCIIPKGISGGKQRKETSLLNSAYSIYSIYRISLWIDNSEFRYQLCSKRVFLIKNGKSEYPVSYRENMFTHFWNNSETNSIIQKQSSESVLWKNIYLKILQNSH